MIKSSVLIPKIKEHPHKSQNRCYEVRWSKSIIVYFEYGRHNEATTKVEVNKKEKSKNDISKHIGCLDDCRISYFGSLLPQLPQPFGANKKIPKNDEASRKLDITNTQLTSKRPLSYVVPLNHFTPPSSYPRYVVTNEPIVTIKHIFCLSFIVQFNNNKNFSLSSNLFPKGTLDIIKPLRKGVSNGET